MNDQLRSKPYDLEERSYQFAKEVALYCKKIPNNLSNWEYAKQVIRSSGSVGANYIEANESLGKKDFLMKLKTCRKEAKESAYWLKLLLQTNESRLAPEAEALFTEAVELKKICSAIVDKSK